MLRQAKEAGYEGVELMQHPRVLGEPERLFDLLQEHRLALVGLAGGSLEERIEYADRMRTLTEQDATTANAGWGLQRYPDTLPLAFPYVRLDEWREDRHLKYLTHTEAMLALYPHMFKPVQTADEANRVLDAHPELRLVPDTAHLVIAGDDPVRVISQNLPRLAAVHLKDWTAEFGRSYQFFARGFVGLGEGDVPVKEVVHMLSRKNYKGWLLVEQDTATDPFASARKSREWLRKTTGA